MIWRFMKTDCVYDYFYIVIFKLKLCIMHNSDCKHVFYVWEWHILSFDICDRVFWASFDWPFSWFCFANLANLHWAEEEVLSYDFNSLQKIK